MRIKKANCAYASALSAHAKSAWKLYILIWHCLFYFLLLHLYFPTFYLSIVKTLSYTINSVTSQLLFTTHCWHLHCFKYHNAAQGGYSDRPAPSTTRSCKIIEQAVQPWWGCRCGRWFWPRTTDLILLEQQVQIDNRRLNISAENQQKMSTEYKNWTDLWYLIDVHYFLSYFNIFYKHTLFLALLKEMCFFPI